LQLILLELFSSVNALFDFFSSFFIFNSIYLDFFSSLIYYLLKGGIVMYFGKNLRYLRKIKNWSQEQVSDKLGYKSFTTIQKWESGDSEPPMNKLRSVCLLFNIPMDVILNYDLEKISHNIFSRIKELKHDSCYQNAAITEALDIAEISYNEWLSGESETYLFYLTEIANFFDVSVDFLIGKTKLFRSIMDNEEVEVSALFNSKDIMKNCCTASEMELIKKYRSLDKHGQELVSTILDKEYERNTNVATSDNTVVINISSKPQSASSKVIPTLNAAHERTDIDIPEGIDTSENDIMDDENF
jgi:transcriptional regulator with XRE-family HTH domain